MVNSNGGGILNYADLSVVGGGANKVVTTGKGGTIVMSAGANALPADVTSGEFVINHGTWSLMSGATTIAVPSAPFGSEAAYPGKFTVTGAAQVLNHGVINFSQGIADEAMATPADWVSVLSSGGGAVINHGAITGNGSPAAHIAAGTGQKLVMIGLNVQNNAAISAIGGTPFLTGTACGGGGQVTLTSTAGTTTCNGAPCTTALFSVQAGTRAGGAGAFGAPGVITIDGAALFP